MSQGPAADPVLRRRPDQRGRRPGRRRRQPVRPQGQPALLRQGRQTPPGRTAPPPTRGLRDLAEGTPRLARRRHHPRPTSTAAAAAWPPAADRRRALDLLPVDRW